ncbi:MAG: hypothetical protein JKY19_13970 [Alcanivoracaceae bacterium]|nr:hypothetical protein [Alcanivoracaceae bacterium]
MKIFIYLTLIISNLLLANISTAENGSKEMYIIKLNQEGMVHYKGEINGLRATSPLVTGAKKLDTKSNASIAYLQFLQDDLLQFKTTIESTLNRDLGKTLDYY